MGRSLAFYDVLNAVAIALLNRKSGKELYGKKAATIKTHIRAHLNEGLDRERIFGGVPSLEVLLCTV